MTTSSSDRGLWIVLNTIDIGPYCRLPSNLVSAVQPKGARPRFLPLTSAPLSSTPGPIVAGAVAFHWTRKGLEPRCALDRGSTYLEFWFRGPCDGPAGYAGAVGLSGRRQSPAGTRLAGGDASSVVRRCSSAASMRPPRQRRRSRTEDHQRRRCRRSRRCSQGRRSRRSREGRHSRQRRRCRRSRRCSQGRRSRRSRKAAVPASAADAAVPAGVGKAAVPAGAAVPVGVGKAAVPAKGGRARRANGDRAGRVDEDPDGTGGDQHAVGVADRVDVEADEVALVVDAVDGGGADPVRVRNCGEPSPLVQVKPKLWALEPVPVV